ncbi:MAG: adaptor protein MecA [Lachnospiraceae bacterium]
MRIEKISDKQIRCTLTQADLQNHLYYWRTCLWL